MLFQSHQEYQCLLVFWSVTDAGIQHSECLWKKRKKKKNQQKTKDCHDKVSK